MALFATIRHIRRLREVEERLLSLESGHQALELEWSNTFDKIRRAMAKLAKRAEAIEKSELTAGNSETSALGFGADGPSGMSVPTAAPGLSQTQANAWTELRRRRGATS